MGLRSWRTRRRRPRAGPEKAAGSFWVSAAMRRASSLVSMSATLTKRARHHRVDGVSVAKGCRLMGQAPTLLVRQLDQLLAGGVRHPE